MPVPIVRSLAVVAVVAVLAGLVLGPAGPAQAGPLPAAGHHGHRRVHCGDVLTGSVRLHHDLACPGDGLTLGADGVTVDLNGHTVSGPATATGIDTAGYDNVTTRRGVLDGFGVVVRHSGHVTVHGVTAPSVSVPFSHHVELRRVRSSYRMQESEDVTVRGGSIAGLSMGFLRGASIMDSRVTGVVHAAFVSGLTFAGCRLDHARLTYQESGGTRFLGNTVVDSSLHAVESVDVEVERNRIVRSSVTADLRSRRMLVRHNEFRGGAIALTVADQTTGLRIENNLFVDDDFGVRGRVTPSLMVGLAVRDNVFLRNRVAGLYLTVRNADHGIETTPGPVTDGGGNVSVRDPSGCLGVTCLQGRLAAQAGPDMRPIDVDAPGSGDG